MENIKVLSKKIRKHNTLFLIIYSTMTCLFIIGYYYLQFQQLVGVVIFMVILISVLYVSKQIKQKDFQSVSDIDKRFYHRIDDYLKTYNKTFNTFKIGYKIKTGNFTQIFYTIEQDQLIYLDIMWQKYHVINYGNTKLMSVDIKQKELKPRTLQTINIKEIDTTPLTRLAFLEQIADNTNEASVLSLIYDPILLEQVQSFKKGYIQKNEAVVLASKQLLKTIIDENEVKYFVNLK